MGKKGIVVGAIAASALGAGALVWWALGRPPEVVLFVVLDAVRADHTSLCGYHRPTTPVLAALAAEGVSACDAVAPGSWTPPSHASYFTGLEIVEHRVRFAENAKPGIGGLRYRRLGPKPTTLAEHFAAAGYETALVSGNPLVSPATGLARGYHVQRVAKTFSAFEGPRAVEAIEAATRELDPEKPLFLTVNLTDAHQPWEAVPDDVGWLPPRPVLGLFVNDDASHFTRFTTDRMTPEERDALLAHVTDSYDWGIHRVDRTLGLVLDWLEGSPWGDRRRRIVVASDHGEFLGEHGLLDHGRELWEANQRVPIVVVQDGYAPPDLPADLNALHVFHLLRDGALPDVLTPPFAAAFPDPSWQKRTHGRHGARTSAAAWRDGRKMTWSDGTYVTYDLTTDPAEAAPMPVATPWPDLEARVRVVRRMSGDVEADAADADTEPVDDETVEALRAVGYVE